MRETGFRGAAPLASCSRFPDNIRELILEKRPSSEIRKAAHKEGMRSLRDSAIEKVQQGLTTLKEINKVTFVE